jgi:[ribosomal protein S18]-alanine N-acetyltransferase
MSLTFLRANDASARLFLYWQYLPPYDIYNVSADKVEDAVKFVLDPQNAYYSIHEDDEQENLSAFCCFGRDGQVTGGDYSADALDIGLGIRPDLTGCGNGSDFVNATLRFAEESFEARLFRVTIASFNLRARRVWQKAGFQHVDTFCRKRDGRSFVIMVYQPRIGVVER